MFLVFKNWYWAVMVGEYKLNIVLIFENYS